jgi:polysaccharide biosynthesis protein PslF
MIDLVSGTRCRLEPTPGVGATSVAPRCSGSGRARNVGRRGRPQSARGNAAYCVDHSGAVSVNAFGDVLVTPATRSPSTYTEPGMPDRRLAGMFAPRSTKPPVSARSIGMLGAYTPEHGGLTSFAAELRLSMLSDRPETSITVVSADGAEAGVPPEVVLRLGPAAEGSRAAAAVLNQNDVVIVHHQAGVYGGTEGDQVLEVLERLTVPVVAVIHDIWPEPTARQRFILEVLASVADAVVALSETSRRILLDEYHIEPRKLTKIQHSAGLPGAALPPPDVMPQDHPQILTWGVLGPDRGVELALRAIALIQHLSPAVHYHVAGPLDPGLHSSQAHSYQADLLNLAEELGIAESVEFELGPLDADRLGALTQQAHVILLPQGHADRTASAVLANAITAGRPIVAADFPYATQILPESGGGIVARGPREIADALARIITEPQVSATMAQRNTALAPALNSSVTAGQYRQLINALLRRSTNR